jgi:hypothetical protein
MQRVIKQSPDDKRAVLPNAILDVATLNTPRAAFDRTVVPLLTGQSVSRRLQNGSVCVFAANCSPTMDKTCLLSYDFPDVTVELCDKVLR